VHVPLLPNKGTIATCSPRDMAQDGTHLSSEDRAFPCAYVPALVVGTDKLSKAAASSVGSSCCRQPFLRDVKADW